MSELKLIYREIKPKYQMLANNTEQALIQFLAENNISSFNVEKRVKEEKSFLEKVIRKSYGAPLEEMEDIAGVRVICYYNEDLEVIDKIIKEQFNVISSSNKSQELDDDQFGYASNHYVVKLKPEWLKAPNYRGLNDLKIEIQVRTILMHAWAAISHKLLYKKYDDVPKEFKRKLNRLSALIELADEQFDDIKNMKVDYQRHVVVDENSSLNADSFLVLMSKYFPNRSINSDDISSVLEEVREYSGSIADFEKRIKKCLPVLEAMEHGEMNYSLVDHEEGKVWSLSGVARTILDLTSDNYWAKRNLGEPYCLITKHYRNSI
ncbi:GTP pyrophosphokinase family protein [Vibrio cholerae]|uniref:GTP pyrophosphokinase n=1 Tax=Vibrio cholerae TaxID=666 RepID=UPI002DBE54E0|nr:(p)ppGpp synthetase [Vibrio cholerae]MEB5541954.1 (p)ppGpp synthetase [Vibrio cholerae]MEB5550586.1 (p)ppGpp synthetase [Vibrio cholerae]